MSKIEPAVAPNGAIAPVATAAAVTPRRRVADYIVPPIVIPAALSIVLLIYMLVSGPV